MVLLEEILLESWTILCLSAPYMLFGFLVAGLLKAFIPDDFIARHLGAESRSNLVKAALFGVPIPLCSCGVLPAAAGIRRQGASKGATSAFLISTPETGVDSIAVTWGLLDPLMAILRPLAAFFSAVFTGQLIRVFAPDPPPSSAEPTTTVPRAVTSGANREQRASKSAPLSQRLRRGLDFAFGDLFHDIVGWFFVGIGIAGLISVFVSPSLIDNWLGHPLVAMGAMTLVGLPLYVCATASTPIAAALVLKGLSPGAALVFLLVGPATNAAAVTVIANLLGRKATTLYVFGIMISAWLLGFAVDGIYAWTELTAGWQAVAHEDQRSWIGVLSALVLFALVLFPRGGSSCCSEVSCECN